MVKVELTQAELARFRKHPWSASGSGDRPAHPLQVMNAIVCHVLANRSASYSDSCRYDAVFSS